MKKKEISQEDSLLFFELDDLYLKFTFEELLQLNAEITVHKEKFYEKKSKMVKFLINFIIVFVLGILCYTGLGIFLSFVFFPVITFFGYKTYKYCIDTKKEKLIVGHLICCKEEYYNSL